MNTEPGMRAMLSDATARDYTEAERADWIVKMGMTDIIRHQAEANAENAALRRAALELLEAVEEAHGTPMLEGPDEDWYECAFCMAMDGDPDAIQHEENCSWAPITAAARALRQLVGEGNR